MRSGNGGYLGRELILLSCFFLPSGKSFGKLCNQSTEKTVSYALHSWLVILLYSGESVSPAAKGMECEVFSSGTRWLARPKRTLASLDLRRLMAGKQKGKPFPSRSFFQSLPLPAAVKWSGGPQFSPPNNFEQTLPLSLLCPSENRRADCFLLHWIVNAPYTERSFLFRRKGLNKREGKVGGQVLRDLGWQMTNRLPSISEGKYLGSGLWAMIERIEWQLSVLEDFWIIK